MTEDATYKEAQYKAAARALRLLYLAYIQEGFSPEESLDLIKTAIQKAPK